MPTELILENLVAYSLQIGLLVGLAAFVPGLLRLRQPGARLVYWHILLAVCLLLPLQPWRQAATPEAAVQVSTTMPAAIRVHTAQPWSLPRGEIVLWLLAAGVLIRMACLAVGLWKLRRYRRHARLLDPQPAWGVEAALCLSDDVASPVTFGWRRPVVLLPSRFTLLDPRMQEAILCHEVMHVRRGDWLVIVSEEIVRALLWFHPAIWWLLAEIGLAREQEVDRLAIEITQARDEYMDALLAAAGAGMQPDLAPAPLFLRKRHLKRRVALILHGARASRARLVAALAAGLGMLGCACWLAAGAFPLTAVPRPDNHAPAPVEHPAAVLPSLPEASAPPEVEEQRDTPAVPTPAANLEAEGSDAVAGEPTPSPPAPAEVEPAAAAVTPNRLLVGPNVEQAMLVKKVVPAYPQLARSARVQGTVRLQAIIGTDGTVQSLRSLSGPDLLIQPAMDAVKQWIYKPTLLNGNPVEVETTIEVNFVLSE